MVDIKPIRLKGNWAEGFALDIHTISSEYLGDDEFGRPHFDTKRSELGQLYYQLKYKDDKSVADEISNTVVDFLLNQWKVAKILDLMIPMPPSNLEREFQPVIEVAKSIGSKLEIPVVTNAVIKVKDTPELKDIEVLEERLNLLEGVFTIKNHCIRNGIVLLFDDLYRSGATLQTVTKILYDKGKVEKVYVLTLTKTRSKR